ncbi:MAG: SUMF1/EgtB/PvdO family nonheme iron enzyme [Thermodesulfobacteriota bacterium]|nr:SUMF1/EgtB/PvdO family nonheme iron enzyme [Thermodesulfobacteriota bacterium]
MNQTISRQGVETALSNLTFRTKNSPKQRLLDMVRQHYDQAPANGEAAPRSADSLIRMIWPGEIPPGRMPSKRKNLNSLRSSINADLTALYQEGKNPEGIIINEDFAFDMCDAERNRMLAEFTTMARGETGISLDKISDVLGVVNDILSRLGDSPDRETGETLNKIREMLSQVTGSIDDVRPPSKEAPPSADTADGHEDDEATDIEEIDEDLLAALENQEIQEIDESALPAAPGDEVDAEPPEELNETDIEETEPGIEMVDETVDEDDLVEIDGDIAEDFDDAGEPSRAEEDDEADGSGMETVEEIEEDELQEIGEEDDIQEIDAETLAAMENDDILELDETDLEAGEPGETDTTDRSDDSDHAIETIDEDELMEVDEDLIEDTAEIDPDADSGLAEDDGPLPDFAETVDTVDEDELEEIDEDQWLNAKDAMDRSPPAEAEATDTGDTENKALSEAFDQMLGAMDKHYNRLVYVPAGPYTIGSDAPIQHDVPTRLIDLAGFYIHQFPVTNRLFEVFVEKTGYKTTAEQLGYGYVYYGRFQASVNPHSGQATATWQASHRREKVRGACWHRPDGSAGSFHDKRSHPVVQVSLEDAMAFAAWNGKRLPSEFEWEGAARTQKGHNLPWGEYWRKNMCNIEDTAMADTTPVDMYPESRNAYGIEDTLGNVLEWTADECRPPRANLTYTRYYIARGGSFLSSSAIRLSARFMLQSGFTANILGFRCVADP